MPVPASTIAGKNIWVAAGDGDLDRVRHLVESGLSPNVPDDNTYTPMHAAASYGHLHVLDYLIAQGGDVNVLDDDGDTPLYVVENVEAARYLVEHGATVGLTNHEGLTAAAYLNEDFPEVSQYLESISPSPQTNTSSATRTENNPAYQLSQHAQNQASELLTSNLLQSVQEIMQRAEADGTDPDAQLRELVGRTVIEGVIAGYGMSVDAEPDGPRNGDDLRESEGTNGVKRSRTNEGPPS